MLDEAHRGKCQADDPERCQAISASGQCQRRIVPGSQHCPSHDTGRTEKKIQAAVRRQYDLGKWQARVNDFADDDQLLSLRAEIGIARMGLESVMNRCKDSSDLLMMSGKISDMISKIEKLVTSCHRMETHLGMMLDKSKIIVLAAQIVEIISREIDDEDSINAISKGIVNAILTSQGTKSHE